MGTLEVHCNTISWESNIQNNVYKPKNKVGAFGMWNFKVNVLKLRLKILKIRSIKLSSGVQI